ncbi:FtsX-like permease family protein [Actinomycetota bacterium]
MLTALRYRRAQALALIALAALVTACTVLAPLVSRGLEQTMLRTAIDGIQPRDFFTTVRMTRSDSQPLLEPESLAPVMSGSARRLHGEPIAMSTNSVRLENGQLTPPQPRVLARSDACAHLGFVSGRCPAKAGEIAVSEADFTLRKWSLGTRLPVSPRWDHRGYLGMSEVAEDGRTVDVPRPQLTVVGVYDVRPDPGYWGGTDLTGKSGKVVPDGQSMRELYDDMVTVPATFDRLWRGTEVSLSYPLLRERLTLDTIKDAMPRAAGADVPAALRGVSAVSPMTRVDEVVRADRAQVRTIVPVLFAQLALLAAIALLLVAQAAVEQRRPEVALARLRGRSRDAAGRLVMGELGLATAIGLPLGLILGLAAMWVVNRTLLADGVPFEVPAGVALALLVSAALCLAAVWLAVRPLSRESIAALLRRVPGAGARGSAIIDVLLLALAGFGVAGLATRTLTGPLALVTPAVLALGVALVAVRLLAPVLDRAGRRALDRGRVARGLGLTGLARRGALRRVAPVAAIATSLVVFAANAASVADDNRAERARLEAGAPAALVTNARSVADVTKAIAPLGDAAAPVAIVDQATADSTSTLLASRQTMERIAYPVAGQAPWRLEALGSPPVPTIRLTGERVTGELRVSQKFTDPQSAYPPGPLPRPAMTPTEGLLVLQVTLADGRTVTRDITRVPFREQATVRINAPLLCPEGCRLAGISYRLDTQEDMATDATLTLRDLRVDGKALDLGGTGAWTGVAGQPFPPISPENPRTPFEPETSGMVLQSASATGGLVMRTHNIGALTTISRADIPNPVPVVTSAPGARADAGIELLGLGGQPIKAVVRQAVTALPVLGDRGALADLDTMLRSGPVVSDQGRVEVWLADGSESAVARATALLGDADIAVERTRRYADLKAAYDSSASAWALRLGRIVGGAALLLASLVIAIVAMGAWRQQAADGAALVASGVPRRRVRSSLRIEEVGSALLGVALGLVCGLASAFLVMPLVPLFAESRPVPVIDLTPRALTVVAGAGISALLLAGVAWLAGEWLARRVELARLREAR